MIFKNNMGEIKMKALQHVVLALFIIIALSSLVSALPVQVQRVEIDGLPLSPDGDNPLDVKRSEDLDVRVVFIATEDLENVQVQADIAGFEFNDDITERLSDVEFVGDVLANVQYPIDLSIPLSSDAEVDFYTLTLSIRDRNGQPFQQIYNLRINTKRRSIEIVDVSFTPNDKVKAGQAILTKVRIENKGQVKEDDVRVTVTIPELGVQQRAFINEIDDEDDEEQTEELYLRIPVCAEAQVYDVEVKVDYSNLRRTVNKVYQIQVIESELCGAESGSGSELMITLGSQLESVQAGKKVSYPITLINQGKQTQSYTLNVIAPNGFDVQVTPSTSVVLEAGKSQTVFLFVTPNKDAEVGPQVITASVMSGTDKIAELSFTADVEKAPTSLLKTLLEIALIGLVVILVILGLVIGFSRVKSESRGKRTEPYY